MSNIYQVNYISKKISVLSDSSLLIEFYSEKDISDFSFKLGKKLKEKFSFILISPTFSSVAVYFSHDANIFHYKKLIEDFINNQSNLIFKKTVMILGFYTPYMSIITARICMRVAEEKKLNNKELIDIHTNKIYIVQFLGFVPGFAYLGSLDKRISLARKNKS